MDCCLKMKIEEITNEKIKEENIKVQQREAEIFEIIHPELFNPDEQERNIRDIDFMINRLRVESPSVVDIGCGTGNQALKFYERGCRVSGVDISPDMLSVFEDKLKAKGIKDDIKLICQDVDEFITGNENKYDIISFSACLHHMPDYLTTIKKAAGRITDGGFIYITHEPSLKQDSHRAMIDRGIEMIDSGLFRIKLFLTKGMTLPDSDYDYSDYHTKTGLDQDKIIDLLRHSGFDLLSFEKYCPRKNKIIYLIDYYLIKTCSQFKLIAQKSNH